VCKKIVDRDMRFKSNKAFLFKRGYKSFCTAAGKEVFLKPVKD